MSTKFTITEGEFGPEYHEKGEKIAFINEGGNLQATHGNAARKLVLLKWLENRGTPGIEWNPEPITADSLGVVQTVNPPIYVAPKTHLPVDTPPEVLKSAQEIHVELSPVCPIQGAENAGDKDVSVMNWWFKNHPDQARVRYASMGRFVPLEYQHLLSKP